MNQSSEFSSTEASRTSFSGLFGRDDFGPVINYIEIPLIQRDYAQGRNTDAVKRIRDSFIDALCHAVLPGNDPIELDFVFGDTDEKGKFLPLDGQQRLTTTFLLHCYLAWRADVEAHGQAWSQFGYDTRPGAREFCVFLINAQPVFCDGLSTWIRDQAEYLPTWDTDPTIQSMLTVLDCLHQKFVSLNVTDFAAVYGRLVDEENLAIRFHVLSMKSSGLSDDLYIKMNSRGKPLTPFENFKAHFEGLLKSARHERADEFTSKVDGDWSEILWHYRGDDNLIDDEFSRYFRYINEINAWSAGIEFAPDLRDDDLSELVYRADAPGAAASVAFLFKAFDVWKGVSVRHEFEAMLASRSDPTSDAVPMFKPFDREGVDLFDACCRHHGTRQWSLAHSLLLYGILVQRMHTQMDRTFLDRLRILRNLIEASDDEIRAGERNNMPKLLREVRILIVEGDLQQLTTFNQAQVANEKAKAEMLALSPVLRSILHRLEDHDLIRGGLTAFNLDHKHFAARARSFAEVFDKKEDPENQPWKNLTGALLAQGDYSRKDNRGSGHRLADFGAPRNDDPWRRLFRGRKEAIHPLMDPLTKLLDAVSNGATLSDLSSAYINGSPLKDWRYYFVKYDAMRKGASGRYTISPDGGYLVCMLDKERLSSLYYDPYLFVIVQMSGMPQDRIANLNWPRCFSGFETDARTLAFKYSGLQLRSVPRGWELSGISKESEHWPAFASVCASEKITAEGDRHLLGVSQNADIDEEDRVELGARLVNQLLAAGL